MLIDASASRKPRFLRTNAGRNRGTMVARATAASLASADSLPTSTKQEDQGSMATFATQGLQQLIDNLSGILGIELPVSAQALEFLRPLHSCRAPEAAPPRLVHDASAAKVLQTPPDLAP